MYYYEHEGKSPQLKKAVITNEIISESWALGLSSTRYFHLSSFYNNYLTHQPIHLPKLTDNIITYSVKKNNKIKKQECTPTLKITKSLSVSS